ncbi:ParA family protein [Gymnodinialimonas sp. 2305UL16-5]|uniref:ParA family protein n=1 Tax=Gymnodinialimonas mytili TaxID=3126503 RepID=UPI0030A8C377
MAEHDDSIDTILIAFVSTKGGVGKSTNLVGLAAGLLDDGHSVCIIDTDLQETSGSWARECARTHPNLTSKSLELSVDNVELAHEQIIEALEPVEFNLLDTAGAASAAMTAAMVTSDIILSPFMLTQPDMDGLIFSRDVLSTGLAYYGEDDDVDARFFGLVVRDNNFISNEDKGRLEALSIQIPLRRGMNRSPSVRRWMEAGLTPKQIKDGITPAADAALLTEEGLAKAGAVIHQMTADIKELINA